MSDFLRFSQLSPSLAGKTRNDRNMPPLVIDVQNAEDSARCGPSCGASACGRGLGRFSHRDRLWAGGQCAGRAGGFSRGRTEIADRRGKTAHAGHQERRGSPGLCPGSLPLGAAVGAALLAGSDYAGGGRFARESLVRRLPEKVRQAVSPANAIGLRVPGHQIILDVMRMLAGPLTLTSATALASPKRPPPGRSSRASTKRSIWCWTTAAAGSARTPRWCACRASGWRFCARAWCPSGRCIGFRV